MAAATVPPIASALVPCALNALSNEPLVSILIGNYNYERYIGASIESVLSQTYQNWELIIVDDGSNDRSIQVIQQYVDCDQRIRLIRKQNGGHTSALNTAFAASAGEIITLLDSDDLYVPARLKKLVAAFAANSECGFVVHRVIRVDQDRRQQGVWPLADLPEGWLAPALLETGGILSYLPPTSGLSLRREVAETLFPLSTVPPLHMCPDQILMRLAPFLARIGRIPDALAECRLHDANTYSRTAVTVPAIRKEVEIATALWHEQRRFLTTYCPAAAPRLAPLSESPNIRLLRYLEAKLTSHSAAREYLSEYVQLCRAQGALKWLNFWRVSVYLPKPVFAAAINLLLGQGRLKQIVAKLRRLA